MYCIHVPGHDPLIFSFLSFILFDWVGVLWPQSSKVLKPVRWAGSVVDETQHETVPGSCGRGGPLYASKWIRSLFPENCVPPIPHQHLSEHGGAHQGERAEHLCIERSQVPGCTLHSLGAYEPAGRAQRAERLPSPQRDQGAIPIHLGSWNERTLRWTWKG